MALQLPEPVYLKKRPMTLKNCDIAAGISIDLSENPHGLFTIYSDSQQVPHDQIDNSKPFVDGDTFTIDIYFAEFTFFSLKGSFTLRTVCECILRAWHSPLLKRQYDAVAENTCELDEAMMDKVVTLATIYPPTTLNGIRWCARGGKFYPAEMQD